MIQVHSEMSNYWSFLIALNDRERLPDDLKLKINK